MPEAVLRHLVRRVRDRNISDEQPVLLSPWLDSEPVVPEGTIKKFENGWVEDSVQDFLPISNADMEFIETRRTLARQVRTLRQDQGLTQTALAAHLKTSQSRVAKMESADAMVSIDLLLQMLFLPGMKRRQLAKAL